MSRIGSMPIAIPSGVTVHVAERARARQGAEGHARARAAAATSTIEVEGGDGRRSRARDDAPARARCTASRARWSPTWSTGVSEGLHARARDPRRRLPRRGARARRCSSRSATRTRSRYQLPAGRHGQGRAGRSSITLEGTDRELLGQFAAAIRELRPPEPYKGKGVRYADETIRRKAGKAGAALRSDA